MESGESVEEQPRSGQRYKCQHLQLRMTFLCLGMTGHKRINTGLSVQSGSFQLQY